MDTKVKNELWFGLLLLALAFSFWSYAYAKDESSGYADNGEAYARGKGE